ncbi:MULTISPECIES: DUF4020 domain-containing protein [unclassified Nocardioides]|uniref:DUF4020 domain-containing protein n=1 Tax=unclassified Nocardioides TaxID=2615069 RepID=UPI000702E0E7|nr:MULTISPECIES: DUF4020 domain-containing protein [unclassified Nocardioides]KRC46426.1 hypothetical protein ASE19_21605 [Nocardioides sp. Root79]KRC69771.1 hypothetical protein ASE20_14465 [Nocardioides sp. Root240]
MRFQRVEIPDDLVTAARDGRMVIFVGAGASLDPPSRLPDFSQLVIDIGTQVGSAPTTLQLARPDVFLGDLTDLEVEVHSLVAKAIDLPGSEPNRLHHAIMRLAAVHQPVRVVTTNYDRHLETAARIGSLEVEIFRSPALPLGDDFAGIVHLHGALEQNPQHLILTDGDFGRAYLREAWAARFLERMFSAFSVLFIGYSHGDVVMQYLARSLGREGRRYVLTSDSNKADWARLGLTAISYPVADKSHVALVEALERWAELSAWGRLDHRRRITELVGLEPSSLPEETSYLKQVLADPERVRFFTEAASSPSWLQWTATRPEFEHLFTAPPKTDSAGQAIARSLTRWFIDNFACVEEHSPAALRLVRDRPWTLELWETLVHRLFAQPTPIADWQVPWLLSALHRSPQGRHDLLDMMLAEKEWQSRPLLALTLLEHRTEAIMRSGLDFGANDDAPRFEVTLTGDEHWLSEAWKKVFTPMLADHARELFDLVVRQIRASYRLNDLLQSGFDPMGFGRSAIEAHPQDDFREPHDMLIDAARDCLERILDICPGQASRDLDLLIGAPETILRRLAVHGWRVKSDTSADAKVGWVLSQGLLYDVSLQHEVYLLLKDVLPDTSSDVRVKLLAAADAGPTPTAGDSSSYPRYNLIVWLHKTLPDDPLITSAFESVQEEHPDYAPREHPDLNMVMTSGFVEDAEPFSQEELHALIADEPGTALARLREFSEADEFKLTGPTWTGALAALRSCVTQYPLDGMLLAPHLQPNDDDIRGALIRGWSAADLSAHADGTLPDQVISVIGSWELAPVRSPAANLLASGGRADHPTRWHDFASARDLARRLWPEDDLAGNVTGGGTYLEAINHPAGDLAEFWSKVTAAQWASQGDMWAGLPPLITAELDRMISQTGRNGLLARCVLITKLRLYFGAAPEWAAAELLPLLAWEAEDTGQVATMWRTFLDHGQYDAALLRAGLLESMLATLDHDADVDDERSMKSLGRQLATVAVRFDDPPTPWLSQLATKASSKVRLAWTRSVGRHLRDMNAEEAHAQWARWIGAYWHDRVASVPRPFGYDEASAIAGWVLHLPLVRDEAVGLVEAVPSGLERDDRILAVMTELDLTAEAPLWARYLTHLLHGTPVDEPWAICHYLAEIVPALRNGSSDLLVAPVIDQALRFGCSSAHNW